MRDIARDAEEGKEVRAKEIAEKVAERKAVDIDMNPPEERGKPGDDYQTPHPESITSLCYSCKNYMECNVKTGTCSKCDQYINKAEYEKTEEQRYSEEQDRIDRETRRKLRQQEDERKMETLPGERTWYGKKVHSIKIAPMYYHDIVTGRKTFELRKNDRGYRVGDFLELMEFKAGKTTGRVTYAIITYMLESYTGLKDGYCILGIMIDKSETDNRGDEDGE